MRGMIGGEYGWRIYPIRQKIMFEDPGFGEYPLCDLVLGLDGKWMVQFSSGGWWCLPSEEFDSRPSRRRRWHTPQEAAAEAARREAILVEGRRRFQRRQQQYANRQALPIAKYLDLAKTYPV